LRRVAALIGLLVALGLPVLPASGLAQEERILYVQGGDGAEIRSVASGGGTGRQVTEPSLGGVSPDWSPDGTQIAFVSAVRRGIYLMNADGTGVRPFAPGAAADPAWSPDGRSIAYTIGNTLHVRSVEGRAVRRLATAGVAISSPTWSPDGGRLAFAVSTTSQNDHIWMVSSGGGRARALTEGAVSDVAPAWSPGGRLIAFVRRDGVIAAVPNLWVMGADGSTPHPLLADTEIHASPAWSPSGGRIVFARGADDASELHTVGLDGTRLRRLTENAVADDEPDWAAVPSSRQRLPDLDQRAPTGLDVSFSNGRYKLGFTSATDNIGLGPIWIRGVRNGRRETMEATQLVSFGDGVRTLPRVGTMRFTISGSHRHWHLLRFQSYELRRAGDFSVAVTDRKSGFCLLDRWGRSLASIRWRPPPRFVGNCGQEWPGARRIEHGTSAGYTDLYPAHFHGQNLDVTNVPTGRYWLVHRANPFRRLRELNYENNDAAVLIRLRWPGGRRNPPAVEILRSCPGAERC
jgi:Tol biopolymer transport system component